MGQSTIFITGGTGFLGRKLIPQLLKQGHSVRALARSGSESKIPDGCEIVTGDPLDKTTFEARVAPADTFIQLVGVAHPSPAKAKEFRSIDLQSARESVAAAVAAKIRHFVYVSVAQPAPIMKAYLEVRAEAESLIAAGGFPSITVLRPWYVLGPGRQWPRILSPVYWLLKALPQTRESANRLGLITTREMIAALVWSVGEPEVGIRVLTVPDIRSVARKVQM